MAPRAPAKPGDLCALEVGGLWVLTVVRQVDELGMVTVATDECGLYFRLEGAVRRQIAAAERVGGQKKAQEMVEKHAKQTFENLDALNKVVRDWVVAVEIGEQVLEELT